ncbi:MAG TPA: type II toxin-antitoxin system VapC family toxin [Polyangiales bacterium]|nr:type II toxin-antitoxin system VapC family toxin [Polyangiales bacterium]
MRLLLDTHILLWSALEPERLSNAARIAIEDAENGVYVSAASAWEIAIKQSLGKLELDRPAEHWLLEVLRKSGFEAIDVSVASALRVRALPWHHRDPFDRLLIAQALEENLTLVTHDAKLAVYGVPLFG